MSDENSMVLLKRFQEGDEQAAAELFHRYFERLERKAQAKMSAPLQRRVGADDVALSVYQSFFARVKNGGVQLQASGELWKKLVHSLGFHVQRHVERHVKAGIRSLKKEVSLDNPQSDAVPDFADQRAIGPADEALVQDEIEALLRSLSDRHEDVLVRAQRGERIAQIAEESGVPETQVRKVMLVRSICLGEDSTASLAQALECSEATVRRMHRALLEQYSVPTTD